MSEYIIDWDENLVIDTFSKNSLREPIVRCRDCKHYESVDETYDCDPIYGCSYFSLQNARIDDDIQEPQDPDGFCAWGERREP